MNSNKIVVCEKILQGVWSDAIGFSSVSVDSDFFELGGHSLTAMTVTNRIADLLGVDVPLRLIFDTPVLADYAMKLVDILEESASAAASG
jgi:hypothetical protein